LAAAAPTEDEAIDLARYPGLPEPVRRYLDWAGVDGRTPIDAARMRHGGTFSTDNGESWLPIRGEEYFTVAPPGFIWR
ncbi:MAG: hypothetical protein GWM90_23065, partial [Gemmatimonadetes bacterium]|nr:hypothetical protein [Gemmatimonadota bacterium]NIQ57532.1 hypothetical protein [Gemmatimonadota bacterium]NIU77690.1 hypothetical protein [Gammaproteobacteria bacterium]NIX23321.1 hypothetical protein [Actinomycetota bacterium]NIX46854.1 hypothetical protein [Gemmatimonadota bacterium]